jgi:hypothetical protein
MADVLARYTPVTAERLRKPEDHNWLLFRRTYDGWGYSPLAQITPANIGRLQLVWSLATGQVEGHQAPPIVNNGVMFVATPGNQLIAIEAKTGSVLWRYKRPLPEDLLTLHPTNRGVGLFGDKIFFASADAVLVALDARTGKEVWTAKVAEYRNGYYTSLMPLVADGKVMLGTSGGELGVRGFVAAYDADTGKEVWRTYTVPEPGQPGSETWPQGDQWKTGGGSIWVPGTYDAETNIAYWGTGQEIEPSLHPRRIDAPAGLHRDILRAVNLERHRHAVDPRKGRILPENRAGLGVEGTEQAVIRAARKQQIATGHRTPVLRRQLGGSGAFAGIEVPGLQLANMIGARDHQQHAWRAVDGRSASARQSLHVLGAGFPENTPTCHKVARSMFLP